MVRLLRSFALLAILAPAVALGRDCPVPDDGSYRRGISKIKYLPETDALLNSSAGGSVRFRLSIDSPERIGGHCYLPVDVRVGDEIWNRFLVTSDGARVLVRMPDGKAVSLENWRKIRRN